MKQSSILKRLQFFFLFLVFPVIVGKIQALADAAREAGLEF